MILYS